MGYCFVQVKVKERSEWLTVHGNDLEGWQSKVKKIAGKNPLNIFEIVELVPNLPYY